MISDIAVSDRTGAIAVADFGNKRIQLFSSDGKFQMQVELDGEPYSVAFTDCGDLLTLVSGNNNKLRLFSEEGQFIKHINDKHLRKAQHLSIASDGRLIITDEASNEVKVLSPDGNEQLVSMTAPNCDKYSRMCGLSPEQVLSFLILKLIVSRYLTKQEVYLHDLGCEGSSGGQF